MAKFTFICNHGGGTTIEYTTKDEFLPDILMSFEDFLRGCGFVFDGSLEIKPEENQDKFVWNPGPYDDPMFDYDENFINTMNEFDDEWTWTVNELEKCSVCNLSTDVMKNENCYDSKCGLKNANKG